MDEYTKLTWILNYLDEVSQIMGLRITEDSLPRVTEDGHYRVIE